jgi:oligopeptide/dipeptide ABC transporter ATP-binding protein
VTETQPIVEVRDLVVEFRRRRHSTPVRALAGVDLALASGETLGIVGESGSGKTTLVHTILGLVTPTSGTIIFDGKDITKLPASKRNKIRGQVQVVFQDPFGSLNPALRVGNSMAEPLLIDHHLKRGEIASRVAQMFEQVGLPPEAAYRYPGQFSGGQCQRIAIGRALLAEPRLLICDEPVSKLDASIQGQVLNLLNQMKEVHGFSCLLISHDLQVVRYMSDRVMVLLNGLTMELGSSDEVCRTPAHPYSRLLTHAVPSLRHIEGPTSTPQVTAVADEEDPAWINGCPFARRCPHMVETICTTSPPRLEANRFGRMVACHRRDEADVLEDSRVPVNISENRVTQ